MIANKRVFTNTTPVMIGGKQPSEDFVLAVHEDGKTPAELYWRKRVADGAIVLKEDSAPPPAPKEKAATPSVSGQAKSNRKGK